MQALDETARDGIYTGKISGDGNCSQHEVLNVSGTD